MKQLLAATLIAASLLTACKTQPTTQSPSPTVAVSASIPSPKASASAAVAAVSTPTAAPTAVASSTTTPTTPPVQPSTTPTATPLTTSAPIITIQATTPSPSPTPSVKTYKGVIDELGTGKFHANFGAGCGYDWALYTSATVFSGAPLLIGSTATVTTANTCAVALNAITVSVTPAATPTPVPTGPPHVLTFGIGYGYAGVSTTVPISYQAQYLTYAFTQESSAAAYRAAGIKVLVYMNFERCYTSDNPAICYNDLKPGGKYAAAEALDCSGNAITDATYGGGYQTDPRTPASLQLAADVAAYRFTYSYAGIADGLFLDDTATLYGLSASPCNYSASTIIAAWNALDGSLASYGPTFVNSLNGYIPGFTSALQAQTVSPSNVAGAMCESCFLQANVPQFSTNWTNQENEAIDVLSQGKIFWAYPKGNSSTTQSQRVYAYASFMLTFDAKHSMYQFYEPNPSNFQVYPEQMLVAEEPTATATDVSGYLNGGVYTRSFGQCFYAGKFLGPCAVAVNPSSTTVALAATSLKHTLTLAGTDVYDGGSAALNGAPVTSLAPETAVIELP